MPVRPVFIPPPHATDDSGYLVLRDGSTALIRVATPEDQSAVQRFIDRLSPGSRRHRFFSESGPSAEVVAALCDASDPRARLTLVVMRSVEARPQIIATGSYFGKDEHVAEVAFAVEDAFRGKGLGTLLLERLALLAIRQGFVRLWAATHAENVAMRDVFKESGFDMRETLEGGEMEVELSLIPTDAAITRSETRHRLATTASLRPFFQPRAVAVIGASRDPASVGHKLVEALTTNGFRGAVFPINPKASEIRGLRAYPIVTAVEGPVDLALIAVPRDAVLTVVRECAAKGVRALVVITAGFAEMNEEGRRLQQQLLQEVRQFGMRMVGPNCFGLVNADPSVRLNGTFSLTFPPPGHVAMSSQSGALGLAILAAARRLNLGISTFVSVGNKADVSGNDLLQYWEEDPETDVILLYLESFGNPRRFAQIARRVSLRKPIVAVKAGRTTSGRRAAGSHTAALAASDVAVEALFHQAGVIRAETLDEMFALATALSHQPLPKGRRVAIVTNAGGPGILCADACETCGVTVPELNESTRRVLAAFLPPAATVKNPVDLIASATPAQYRQAIETILAADEVDAVIVLYIAVTITDTSSISTAILDGIATARNRGAKEKPVYICWMAEGDTDRRFQLPHEIIPSYPLPEVPATVLGRAAAYGDWRRQPTGLVTEFDDVDLGHVRHVCAAALTARGAGWLSVKETRRVLAAMRLPLSPGGVARTADQAAGLAREIGYPVAVKLASHQIVHKTEIGGVKLNLANEPSVRDAVAEIERRVSEAGQAGAMEGVLVQRMCSGGVEVMIGVTQDPLFGPLIAFGLGGIHVEILGDVRFRITPLTDRDAAQMIRDIRGYRLLAGYRGHPPADIEAIENALLRVSRLVEAVPEITELDLNPIFALPPGQGCRIVDARIRVGRLE